MTEINNETNKYESEIAPYSKIVIRLLQGVIYLELDYLMEQVYLLFY